MISRTTPTQTDDNTRNQTTNRISQALLGLLAAATLLGAVLPGVAHATNDRCVDLFMTEEARRHEQEYEKFVRTDSVENRLGFASSTMMLLRLRKLIPAGEYDVTVNHLKREKLYVSYDTDGHVTFSLSGHTKVQSDSRNLQRGFVLAKNVSYGIDGRLQLLNGSRLIVSTTIIRGDEKTLAGLDRTDVSIEIDLNVRPVTVLKLTETLSNWSTSRAKNETKTTQTRIEPRG